MSKPHNERTHKKNIEARRGRLGSIEVPTAQTRRSQKAANNKSVNKEK